MTELWNALAQQNPGEVPRLRCAGMVDVDARHLAGRGADEVPEDDPSADAGIAGKGAIMISEAVTVFTCSTEASCSSEVERIARAIEEWPDCKCVGFCECYGRDSFKVLADHIRAKFGIMAVTKEQQ